MTERRKLARRAFRQTIHIDTSRRTELKNVTTEVEAVVRESHCESGVCHIYVPHTTAGVIINEGYDPAVAREIESEFDRLVPMLKNSAHDEGNSDSHVKTALVGSSETIFVENGLLVLGRWQVIYFIDFDGPRRREMLVKIVPDAGP
jgi:secondary thiamine-phosphate synthase enzyme